MRSLTARRPRSPSLTVTCLASPRRSQQGATLQNYNNELVKCAPHPRAEFSLVPASRCAAEHARGPTELTRRRRSRCAGIEDLREKREEVNRSIAKDEEEKAKIQNDLRILTERLARLNDNLARKIASRNEYDKTIQETEAAYAKIMESSQTLLHVLKRESVNLTKKKQASS